MPTDDPIEMQSLRLVWNLWEAAVEGSKTSTIRLGHRDIEANAEIVLIDADDSRRRSVEYVREVMHGKLRDVPKVFLEGEALDSADEALAVLQDFYPEITLDSEVTAVRWG